MLDLALVNANILYNHAAQKPMKHLDFRLEIIRSLLEGHVARTDRQHFSSTSELPLRGLSPNRSLAIVNMAVATLVRFVEQGDRVSKTNTGAKFAKFHFIYILVWKYTTLRGTITHSNHICHV